MTQVSLSLLLLPLLSALVTLLFLRKHGSIASLLSVASAGGILAFSSYLIFGLNSLEYFTWKATWFQLSDWEL